MPTLFNQNIIEQLYSCHLAIGFSVTSEGGATTRAIVARELLLAEHQHMWDSLIFSSYCNRNWTCAVWFFFWSALTMTKCPITHFATHMFSETVTIFVEAQPQGTENGS